MDSIQNGNILSSGNDCRSEMGVKWEGGIGSPGVNCLYSSWAVALVTKNTVEILVGGFADRFCISPESARSTMHWT